VSPRGRAWAGYAKMKRMFFGLALAASFAAAWATGCGDDAVFADTDAGTFDSGTGPDAGPLPSPDAASDGGDGCGDATGAPPRLLLSMNNATSSELVAFNLDDKAVDGRLTYPDFLGTTAARGADPFLMQQETDVVARLDAQEPWKIVSSWNVRGDDLADGGLPNANPAAVVVPACGKGYVLRFNRNEIAVIDTAERGDAAAPVKTIDLAPLLQAGDRDGIVEMTSALYVPSKKRLYVLLGNVDLRSVATDGYSALCADTKPTIVAIDTESDQVVSLGGAGPGGSITLDGYNPPLGTPFWYDAARDRLLVLSAGCNTDDGSGGPGPIEKRRVEEVDLATRQVKTLLDLDGQGFPSAFLFVDGARAAVAFFGPAFFWNPSEPTLGPEIPGGFELMAYDGRGNIVGTSTSHFADGGNSIEVRRVPFADGGAPETLGADLFSDGTGFVSGAELWPRP
jgi:hypothetical protein